ncbi:MAG: A24 family peptidase [Pseudomonadota bacterium]
MADWLDVVATPFLLAALGWITVTDIRSHRIPDAVSLPLIGAGLALASMRSGGLPSDHLIGAAAAYLVFAAFGEAFYRLRGREGLGLGDAKLLAAAGAWLGWADLPLLVVMAAGGALLFGMVRAWSAKHQLAFGPWLAMAFAVLWLRFLVT